MWSTNIICRRLLGLLARADQPTPVARLLGYYNAEGRSYSAWQTDLAEEARTFLATRMNTDLENELARGGTMSDREAMEYMQTICDELAQ